MKEQKDSELQQDSLHGPMEFTDLVARIIKDCVLFLLVGICLFSLMSILGYDTKDPGWSHVGYQPNVTNWAGSIGALWADIAFSFIGLLAWVVPLMLLYPCVRLYKRKKVTLLDSLPFVMLRVIGAIVVVFSCCALFSLHLSNTPLNYPFSAGGIIGQAFSDWLVSWFSIQGSSVVLWFSMLIGATLFMELSWRDLIIGLGSAILYVYEGVHEKLSKKPIIDEPSASQATAGIAAKSSALSSVEKESVTSGISNIQTPAIDVEKSVQMGISAPARAVNNDSSSIKTVFADKLVKRFIKTNTDTQLENSVIDKESSIEAAADAQIDAHLAKPLPLLSSLKATRSDAVELKSDSSAMGVEPALVSIKSVDEKAVTQDTSQNKVDNPSLKQLDTTKRALKIVPLSETHQSTLDEKPDFSGQAKVVSVPSKAQIPSVDLLDPAQEQIEIGYTAEQLEDMSRLLEVKLKDFGVVVEVVEVNPGPVITRFEIQPAAGVKSSKIVNLAKDLARSLAVMSVRVVEVIPGKSVMGIEIPNINRKMVRLSEVLTAPVYQDAASKLTLALGNDIAVNPVVANLGKMPHLLVAGTTGSGKSVGVNAMILSLLFKAGPEDVRLMLVDPKMLELSIYEGIPHLLTPVITDMREAAGGLRWCVAEMERRYKLMSKMGVRNLDGFNDKVRAGIKEGVPLYDPLWDPQEHGETPGTPAPALEVLPYIVVVIDEFADMMMIVGKKVEELIARIAQKARAAGIHLILATQRPSVDVITGLIKANVPTRIAFQVSSKIDSRTILDQGGAENLLGNGDMLYLPAGTSVPSRVHGAFVSDDEVHRTVEAWKLQGKPQFIDMQVAEEGTGANANSLFEDDEQDALYDESVAFITTTRKASISSVQRKFKIGYNRAARIIESMEAAGVITSAGNNGQREVLAPPPPRD